MAIQIIEKWHLAVLRAQLDLSYTPPIVATELVGYFGGTPRRLWALRYPLDEFGLAQSTSPPRELTLPADLRDHVAASLEAELEDETALWLRLAPPYGYLGAVPWEQSLRAHVPLLRVPDRLPVAADPGQVWSVAIGVSAPEGTDWAAPYVADLAGRIAIQVAGPLDVHVFADAGTAARLRQLTEPGPEWLHVHEPSAARLAWADRSGRGQERVRRRDWESGQAEPGSPGRIWTDWLAAGLAGQAVRALHVVLDATWDSDRPMLALAPDPSEPSSTRNCAFVTGDDVRLLADAVGAATLSFGAPPDVSSDVAMRVVADAVGQQRPGTTVYSSIRLDRHGAALADMHGFLADERFPRQVPTSTSLFAYLQPEKMQPRLAEEWPGPPPTAESTRAAPAGEDLLPATVLPEGYQVAPEADLSDYYASAQTVPSWVATSERYIGSQLASLSRPASAPEPVGDKQAYEQGAAEALSELQQMVARHARPK